MSKKVVVLGEEKDIFIDSVLRVRRPTNDTYDNTICIRVGEYGAHGEGTRLSPEEAKALIEELSAFVENAASNPRTRLVHRFLALPYRHQVSIISDLGFLDNEYALKLNDDALFKMVFQRAQATGVLAELWNLVEMKHGEPEVPISENPFRNDVATRGKIRIPIDPLVYHLRESDFFVGFIVDWEIHNNTVIFKVHENTEDNGKIEDTVVANGFIEGRGQVVIHFVSDACFRLNAPENTPVMSRLMRSIYALGSMLSEKGSNLSVLLSALNDPEVRKPLVDMCYRATKERLEDTREGWISEMVRLAADSKEDEKL